jgi:hypothetical protein
VQEQLKQDPFSGHLFIFRGRRGGLIKVIWHDGHLAHAGRGHRDDLTGPDGLLARLPMLMPLPVTLIDSQIKTIELVITEFSDGLNHARLVREQMSAGGVTIDE